MFKYVVDRDIELRLLENKNSEELFELIDSYCLWSFSKGLERKTIGFHNIYCYLVI